MADGRRQGADDAIAYNSPSRMIEGDISMKAVNDLAVRPSWRLLASNSSMRIAEGRTYDCVTGRTPSPDLIGPGTGF